MPQRLPPQFYKDFSNGMITNVNENLMPQNAVKLLVNAVVDEEIGSVVSRLGTGRIGSQLVDNMTVLGLIYFNDDNGSNHKLLAAINAAGGATSVVYDVVGGSTIITGLTASLKLRGVVYLGSVLLINGTDGARSYNGSSVITTGGAFDLANIPTGHKYCIEFLDRVYLAGNTTDPDTIQYSSVPVDGAISWTVGNGSVTLEQEDGGGGITGFGKVPGYLLIFKHRAMKRWNFQSAFPESLVNIGTPSQESVITAAGICGFFSASSVDAVGFYITNGGRPEPISHLVAKNIRKWVDAIPSSYYANVSGIGTETHFYWSIGDVTVDGVAYTNVVLRWSVKTGEWCVYTLPSELRVFSLYTSSNQNLIVAGDDDGNIIQLEKAGTFVDYESSPINWKIQTHQEKFQYNQKKTISERMIINSRNAKGARVAMIADGKNDNPIRLGEITADVADVKIKAPVTANYIEFVVEGNQTGNRAVIKEIEVPNISVADNY